MIEVLAVSAYATAAPVSPSSDAGSPVAGLAVTGIVGGASRVAIIEREGATYIVRVGDHVGAATVVGIGVDRVVLKQGGRMFTLPLTSASRTNSLATRGGATTGGGATPGSSGAASPQTQPAGTSQPPQPGPANTTGVPAVPGTAQPGGAPGTPGAATPVPGFALPTGGLLPPGYPISFPVQGQGASGYQVPPQGSSFLVVVPSNTPQPLIPPVIPFGSYVYTPPQLIPVGVPVILYLP